MSEKLRSTAAPLVGQINKIFKIRAILGYISQQIVELPPVIQDNFFCNSSFSM